MPQLRRLTAKGIARFQRFIDSMAGEDPETFDPAIVNHPDHSTAISGGVVLPEACDFADRFEAAEFLANVVQNAGLSEPAYDRGFWCWLAWVWFESLCPIDRRDRRKPGDSARWILNLDWNRYYRHFLAGPWWVYNAHRDDPERARCLLCTHVASPGELVEQVASRQELVTNPGFVAMLTRLYYDPASGKLKRGHATKGAGSARRIASVADQLDMIWDLYSTSAEEFLNLIPGEFDRFRPNTGTSSQEQVVHVGDRN